MNDFKQRLLPLSFPLRENDSVVAADCVICGKKYFMFADLSSEALAKEEGESF